MGTDPSFRWDDGKAEGVSCTSPTVMLNSFQHPDVDPRTGMRAEDWTLKQVQGDEGLSNSGPPRAHQRVLEHPFGNLARGLLRQVERRA